MAVCMCVWDRMHGSENQSQDQALAKRWELGNREKPFATLFHSIDYKNLFLLPIGGRSRCKMLRKMEKRVVVAVRLFLPPPHRIHRQNHYVITWYASISVVPLFLSLLVASVWEAWVGWLADWLGLKHNRSGKIHWTHPTQSSFARSPCTFACKSQHPNGNIAIWFVVAVFLFFSLFLSIFLQLEPITRAREHTLQTYNNLLNIINVNNQISLCKISINPMQIPAQTHNTRCHRDDNGNGDRTEKTHTQCLFEWFRANSNNAQRYKRVINSHDSQLRRQRQHFSNMYPQTLTLFPRSYIPTWDQCFFSAHSQHIRLVEQN